MESLDAIVDPCGLLGVWRKQGERHGPEFAGLGQEAAILESACVVG